MKLKSLTIGVLLAMFLMIVSYSYFSRADANGTVLISLNSTTVWWGDGVRVNGTAAYTNGSSVDGNASVLLNGAEQCWSNVISGAYGCNFSAPNELGSYTISVNVTNAMGSSIVDTFATQLVVKPTYGETPVGTVDRVVYEIPMLLQDFNGKIKHAIARVMIWQS